MQGDSVRWLKLKWIRFSKFQPDEVKFKYNLTDPEFKTFRIGNSEKLKDSLKQKYFSSIPLSTKKVADLKALLSSGVIPARYKSFYENLPLSKNAKDVIEVQLDDDEDGEQEEKYLSAISIKKKSDQKLGIQILNDH